MTTEPNAVQPIPEGYHTVTPWISSRDTARLLDFVKKAFGAEELARVYVENVDSREMAKRATEEEYLDAMRYAQESLDRELRSRRPK